MRQRDVEDRVVDPLHDVRQHDRERDQAAVGDRSDSLTFHRSPSRRSLLVALPSPRRSGSSTPIQDGGLRSQISCSMSGFAKRQCRNTVMLRGWICREVAPPSPPPGRAGVRHAGLPMEQPLWQYLPLPEFAEGASASSPRGPGGVALPHYCGRSEPLVSRQLMPRTGAGSVVS